MLRDKEIILGPRIMYIFSRVVWWRQGTEGDASLRNSKGKEPPPQSCDAAGEEAIELKALKADHNGGNSYLRSTVPVTIVEDQ